MKLILTHENADFDAVASMLGAFKLYPDAIPLLPNRLTRGVDEFIQLYKSALPFVSQKDWKHNRQQIQQIILTDTQTYQSLKGVSWDTPIHIIDHHPLERDLLPHETWAGDTIGSACTLVVEQIREQAISVTSLEATLLALGIYADTGMLTFGATTQRDVMAVAWLLEQGAVLDTVRRFLTLPMTDPQQALFDKLLQSANHKTIQGHTITVASTHFDEYVDGVSQVTQQLTDIWESGAIFVLVEMPMQMLLVGRSRVDDIDVSTIAENFGGGGHARASAATIKNQSLVSIVKTLWQHLNETVRPAIRVADLMSYGLQYLYADDALSDKLSIIRRIGHEGYPVVDNNRVVGLLTRRDADRATEHNLKSLSVRDVMIEGNVTLSPEDSIASLEKLIVESGWGQIPVVDTDSKPIGIVTRTDLIQHWAMTYPNSQPQHHQITVDDVQAVLGQSVAHLIMIIAESAQEADTPIYMVGGVVRDLLLRRENLDIDFVVEGDAIRFTEGLAQTFGGTCHSHEPFKTAKWLLDKETATQLKLDFDVIPHHIDFATARFEYYEQPTALPTVYRSSIKLDLQRRDFTINTLAIQLSPPQQMWHILDNYGGIRDINAGIIRVLHSLSFVDDPTRIIRAVRFSERLQFTIDPRTIDLIQGALPMLKRITGERIQNEITLLLREVTPEHSILKLQAMGVLEAIHPDFRVTVKLTKHFQSVREQTIPWTTNNQDNTLLYWHIFMIGIASNSIEQIGNRLGLGRALTQSMIDTASLLSQINQYLEAHTKPSEITQYLETMPTIALDVAWLISSDELRSTIYQFVTVWQNVRATINGNDLKKLGIPPGPEYKAILDSLRYAWLDSDIISEAEEQAYLRRLILQDK